MADHAPEKMLGPYRVLSILGKGGMATVYKAEDTRDGSIVAVKIMAMAYTERKDMALRFRREFRAIQRLSHPNVVHVMDAGEVDGAFYFAMEFVDGVDLAKYFALRAAGKAVRPEVLQAPGRVRKVLEVAFQVAESLFYIHSERIVHRDLKPTNIFVTREGVVKLMDFGIAKELDQTAALTRHGSFLGTAYYTAPEQIKGSRDLDGRADLYALGIMLYEALSGRLPFYSDNTVEVLRMHILEMPDPPQNVNPLLPEDASGVVMKLLAKDPAERYRDARALAEAVKACADFPKDKASREWKAPVRRPVVASGLVGRQKELGKLVDAVDATIVGTAVFASVSGPLGVGKTRLIQALGEHVRASAALMIDGRYNPDRAGPYLAWREVLAASVGYLMGYGIPFTRKVVGEHGRILRTIAPAFEKVEAERPAPVRLDPEEDRLRLFEAVLGYVRALARVVPVTIVLDNFHWAYEADYELVAYLLRGLAAPATPSAGGKAAPASSQSAQSVMLVVAFRDDEMPPDHAFHKVMMSRPDGIRYVEVRLGPFSRGEVRDFLVASAGGANALGGDDAVDRLVVRVMNETLGNPYHVEEVVKAMVSPALLEATPRLVVPTAQRPAMLVSDVESTRADPEAARALAEALRVGDTTRRNLGDLVLSRVNALSDDGRTVLRAASVIGEDIEFEVLARLAEVEDDVLLDVLDDLLRDKLLAERDRGDLFEFHQNTVREAVYNTIPEGPRARLHARMVELLEPRAKGNPEGFAALVALHAERAGDHESSARYYLAAGDAALAGNRVDEAERYYQRVRELGGLVAAAGGGGTTAEMELESRRGNVLLARGEAADAAKVYETIVAHAKQKGETRFAGEIAWRLGVAYTRAGSHVLATANLEWALSVARILEDAVLEGDAREGLGSAHLVRGNFDKALEHMKAALVLRKKGGDRVGATRALYGAARALAARGELQSSFKMHRDALKLSVALSETAGAARGHADLGELCRLAGRVVEAQGHFDQALELGRKAGARDVEIAACTSLSMMATDRADSMVARKLAEEATQLARNTGDKKLLSHALLAWGDEALWRYDLSASKAKFEEARTLAHKLGDRVARAATARALARVAIRSRALDSARAYLGEARRTHEKVGDTLGLHEDIVDEGTLAIAEAISQTGSVGGPRSTQAQSLLEPAAAAIEATLPDLLREGAERLRAHALLVSSELCLALRKIDQAIAASSSAHALAERCGVNDVALRARLVAGRAHFLAKRYPEAGVMYKHALALLKSAASQIPDKAERLVYLAEPDRRSLVDEVKTLAQVDPASM